MRPIYIVYMYSHPHSHSQVVERHHALTSLAQTLSILHLHGHPFTLPTRPHSRIRDLCPLPSWPLVQAGKEAAKAMACEATTASTTAHLLTLAREAVDGLCSAIRRGHHRTAFTAMAMDPRGIMRSGAGRDLGRKLLMNAVG